MSATQAVIDALGPPTTIEPGGDAPTVLVYTRPQLQRWIDSQQGTPMRKPGGTYVQLVERTESGVLPTLEGPQPIHGGMLCCSRDPDRPGAVVDPFVQTRGLAALAAAGGLYEPVLADPTAADPADLAGLADAMQPTSVVGAAGCSAEVLACLLDRPYFLVRPTPRVVYPAPWSLACSSALHVRFLVGWNVEVAEPSHVVVVPGSDDVYAVTTARLAADGWIAA